MTAMQMISPPGHIGGAVSGTQAVRAGNLIFVGGQMSLDASGRVIGSTIREQATNAFESLRRPRPSGWVRNRKNCQYPHPPRQ